MTRLCIVGAGAIGGFLGARLASIRPHAVSAYARGATLRALQTRGWRLQLKGGSTVVAPARASDDAATLGRQDIVFIAVKGPALSSVVQEIKPLIDANTVVVPLMNGVPWWFCIGQPRFEKTPLQSVDPSGQIAAAIPFAQVLGGVVHASCSLIEPGFVHQKMGQGLIIGEPVGGKSQRAQSIVDMLGEAGFDASFSDNIRADIWYKLWGNLTMNPISVLTGATIDRVLADPLLREFCTVTMREVSAIGEHIGCRITQSPEDRHLITAKLGAFKTSMLQDAEAGRMIELDAIVGAVREISHRLDIPSPSIDTLLGLTRLCARTRGIYPDASS